jgi:hypothetical protein
MLLFSLLELLHLSKSMNMAGASSPARTLALVEVTKAASVPTGHDVPCWDYTRWV